ncbi:MAG: hypothetical protein AMJ46_14370 [Latescibacteria bacterium DG_63]|nr:MAG: hypothetical protein AMJ46_14370 [Latescibacteria bacterium DG_63]
MPETSFSILPFISLKPLIRKEEAARSTKAEVPSNSLRRGEDVYCLVFHVNRGELLNRFWRRKR